MLAILGTFINQKSNRISSAALTVAFFGLVSRLLGLWRDRLLAGQFGAGRTLDIYYAAFRIPDLVYNLLIVGAVSSAFLPVFYEYLTKNKDEAWRFAANALNILIAVLLLFSGILFLLAPQLMNLVAPGFDAASKALAVSISRLLFLSPLFLGISSLVSSLLQAFSKFLITSLAPVFYNLGIVLGILFLTPQYGIWGLAYGVVFGALLHLLIQIPALFNTGFQFRRMLNFKESGLIKSARLWAPRTLSLAAFQINSVVSTAIASVLASGSIAIFNFADNLRWVPIGIVGVAFSTAAFPAMSLAHAEGKRDLFLKRFSLVVRQALFIVVPLSVFIFALRSQIVSVILETGNFSWQDAKLTAAALGIFSFGIFSAALYPVFTRAFFAIQNTKTPVIINVFSMVINIAMSFLFVQAIVGLPFLNQKLMSLMNLNDLRSVAILGLPLAVAISSIINVAWHWIDLKRYIGDFGIKDIKKSALKILIASAIAIAVVYGGLYIFSYVFNTAAVLGLLLQTLFSGLLGGAAYLITAFIFGMDEILMLKIPATLLKWRGIKDCESDIASETNE